MWYRRNADTHLRKLEREYQSTGNRDLLLPINRERRRAGLAPHPEARIVIANSALFKLVPKFAQQLLTALEVYDEVDIPMYLAELPAGEGSLQSQLLELTEEIEHLEEERRTVSRAIVDFNVGEDFSPDYIEILNRHDVRQINLGEIPKIEEEPEEPGNIPYFSSQQRQQMARGGYEETLEQLGRVMQLVSRRALKVYRKLLAYGALPMREIIENDPEIATNWPDYELAALDEQADNIEIVINEIIDTTQDFGPSPDATQLLAPSWYGEPE